MRNVATNGCLMEMLQIVHSAKRGIESYIAHKIGNFIPEQQHYNGMTILNVTNDQLFARVVHLYTLSSIKNARQSKNHFCTLRNLIIESRVVVYILNKMPTKCK